MSQHKTQNLNKINQIILYSQNYAAHKKMISDVKPSVDSLSPQRNNYNRKLTNQHSRYVHAVQKLKHQELNQSNKYFSDKLIEISKPYPKEKIAIEKQKQATSRSFWNLKTARQRQRSKEQTKISQENIKMTERISKSRSKQNFGRESYYKQKAQTMKDLNIRSEYSQRSQSVLENLVYNDLKINGKDIPFLPLLSQRHKIVGKNIGKVEKPGISKNKFFKSNFQRESFSFEREMNFKL